METPSAELCSCRRDKHVVALCRTKICPTRNAGDWDADVVEAGRIVLADTVKCRDCYFELYSLYSHYRGDVKIGGIFVPFRRSLSV